MLDVPQLGGVVHGACGYQEAVWVEAEADDLHLMPFERVFHLAVVGVPNLGCAVKGPCYYEVSKRIIESHSVYNILMLIEGEEFLTGGSVPDLATPIVGSSNELIARLVEGTVG